jgi:hypothetical protein
MNLMRGEWPLDSPNVVDLTETSGRITDEAVDSQTLGNQKQPKDEKPSSAIPKSLIKAVGDEALMQSVGLTPIPFSELAQRYRPLDTL